ncbi:MAG: hypothetical protein AABW80_04610 [Nanoarchaeota archaeon]
MNIKKTGKLEKSIKEDANLGLHDNVISDKQNNKLMSSMAGSLKKYFKNKQEVISREDILKDLRDKKDRDV